MGLASERRKWSDLGLLNDVMHTLQSARAPSTNAAYQTRWRVFCSWCESQNADPESCNVQTVLQFLQSLLDAGRAASTLKVYLAAISACHDDGPEGPMGSHPLLSRFLKGVRRLCPVRAPLVPTWDLDVVLSALTLPPFEPLGSVSLKHLSLKVAFLLAITSTKRVSELHALSVSAECFRMGPDKMSVTLRPNPSFLPKVLSTGHVNRPLHLSAYTPPTSASGIGTASSVLCPVRALDTYVTRTRAFRKSDQLFVCYGERVLGQRLSKQRLSHWIVDTITTAYQLAGRPLSSAIVAHSTRGVAASWALLRGVPLADVCAAASWASPSTFARFYQVNVAPSNEVERAVLGVASASLGADDGPLQR